MTQFLWPNSDISFPLLYFFSLFLNSYSSLQRLLLFSYCNHAAVCYSLTTHMKNDHKPLNFGGLNVESSITTTATDFQQSSNISSYEFLFVHFIVGCCRHRTNLSSDRGITSCVNFLNIFPIFIYTCISTLIVVISWIHVSRKGVYYCSVLHTAKVYSAVFVLDCDTIIDH